MQIRPDRSDAPVADEHVAGSHVVRGDDGAACDQQFVHESLTLRQGGLRPGQKAPAARK